MKTKAYSKEGLSAAAKLDPKEKEKSETCDFLSSMVDELQQKIEAMEAEEEILNASMKKGKKDVNKTNRLSDISRISERHRWHIVKLELLLRALQNGNVETNEVLDVKESIKYYVEDGHNVDFSGEDETIYDDLNLGDEEGNFATTNDDKVSSQDTQSIQEDDQEPKSKAKAESSAARRPSAQMKSPLPVLATLHLNNSSASTSSSMKPAPPPARLPGETLKYASAAAAAAASDKNGVGIAPLPPPPGASPAVSSAVPASRASSTASPRVVPAQPARGALSTTTSVEESGSQSQSKSPTVSPSVPPASVSSTVPPTPAMDTVERAQPRNESPAQTTSNVTNGEAKDEGEADESIYHLPPGLQDLMHSFEATKSRVSTNPSASVHRLLVASHNTCPEAGDAEKPRHYKPQTPYNTPLHYPQEVLPIFDDPRLYETGRIDTDTLFYIFYYRQGTYQQYLAAKSLKNQSWRFHKQYQTWFQRHEEPKTITEEFEQGTYRFFDYESTWYVFISRLSWGPSISEICLLTYTHF